MALSPPSICNQEINLETKLSLGLSRPRVTRPIEEEKRENSARRKGRKARRKEGKEKETKEKAFLVEFSC